jgi:phospho-N-acetylmuramoyl-pentapeptide-transferase
MLTIQAAVAVLLTLALVLAGGWPVIRWLRHIGMAGGGVREDTPDSHRAKAGTPSMGGVLIVPVAAVAIGVAGLGDPMALGVAGGMLGFAGIGAADDLLKARRSSRRGLMARTKFLLQVIVATAVAFYAVLVMGNPGHVRLLPFMDTVDMGPWAIGLWILYLLWMTNAVNITDGLDGLATGLTALACVPVFVAGLLTEAAGLTVGAAGILGGSTGFLRFNRRPAHVWMGDTGSLGLGAGLGCLGVLGSMEWLVLLAALPFTLELLSVVIQVVYFQATKRIYKLDEGRRVFRKAPLHHHFEEGGSSEGRVVQGFWAAGVGSAVLAMGLLIAEAGGLP